MLGWFNLTDVRIELKNDTKLFHIHLDVNEITPDGRTNLHTNGFTRESVYNDFPIRGHELLLHIRHRRWL